jgi:hypothetical protein
MAKQVSVEVKASKLSGFWVAIDEHDLKLRGGKHELTLESGDHVLVWWMMGNAGGTLGVEATDSRGNVVCKLKESKIPDGETLNAGTLRFVV